jgi:16S rRNA (cytosine967-C5)-methyltransferase
MTPAARVQAAIEIVDAVIASAREDGPPADAIVSVYFKTRRYAGSKDRRAVRDLVFRAIRRSAEIPANGRTALLGL